MIYTQTDKQTGFRYKKHLWSFELVNQLVQHHNTQLLTSVGLQQHPLVFTHSGSWIPKYPNMENTNTQALHKYPQIGSTTSKIRTSRDTLS